MGVMVDSSPKLGAQVWLEPDDSCERVDHLFATMRHSGMGWARLFLMWPWIEPRPGEWTFTVFDRAFDAATRHGIKIKATLTANSGPWHIGTPSVLHSFTGVLDQAQLPAMETYIRTCVGRYATHPALGQWLLWNEPFGAPARTQASLEDWRTWLKAHFRDDIEPLNQRWRTGYGDFSEIPFPEDIPHPSHRGDNWNSYGPWLLDWRFRGDRVLKELNWIRSLVKELDAATEIVINPNQVIANHAESATDLAGMGNLTDSLGASFHPAWHFTFAHRSLFPALIAAGIRLLSSHAPRVEVTELQFGNTVNSSVRPSAVLPDELKRLVLAGLAAGAEQIIGWCLNVRSHDFEAGDWGLLDNQDQPSPRSEALKDLSQWLARVENTHGELSAEAPEAHVLVDPRSQALEWVEAMVSKPVPGRNPEDGAQGAGLIAATLCELGIGSAITSAEQLPEELPEGTLIIVSHLVAFDASFGEKLARLARQGAILIIDATSGRKSFNADLHRPWPAGFAPEGLIAADLESNPAGFELAQHGHAAGSTLLCRMVPASLDPEWKAYGHLRYACDDSPVVLQKHIGKGVLVLFRSVLGPSLLQSPELRSSLRGLFAGWSGLSNLRPRPAHPRTGTISIPCRLGSKRALLSLESPVETGSTPRNQITLTAPDTLWIDAASGIALEPDRFGEVRAPLRDGISLIVEEPAG